MVEVDEKLKSLYWLSLNIYSGVILRNCFPTFVILLELMKVLFYYTHNRAKVLAMFDQYCTLSTVKERQNLRKVSLAWQAPTLGGIVSMSKPAIKVASLDTTSQGLKVMQDVIKG